MVGIHWRFDGQEGLLLGEMVGVRILQQVRDHTHPRQSRTIRYPITGGQFCSRNLWGDAVHYAYLYGVLVHDKGEQRRK